VRLHHLEIEPDVLAGNGALGRTVLLPGSVERAARIGERLVDHRVHTNRRRLDVHTGVLLVGDQRVDVAAIPTGMGCPSVDIVAGELFTAGVRRVLRVGTAGTLHPTVRLGHLVIASGAVRDEGASDAYTTPRFPAIADPMWVAALADAADAHGWADEVHVGLLHTKDSFFGREFGVGPDKERNEAYLARLSAAGVLASEMEAAHLFVLGSVFGAGLSSVAAHRTGGVKVRCGAVCAVVGSPEEGFAPHALEVATEERMITLALSAAARLLATADRAPSPR
jgi:uridine phosphorylase